MLTVCVLAEDSAPCLHFCLPLVPPPSALLASWKSDTQNAGDLLRQAVETEIDLDDVESIDWWGDQMSAAGKRLRLQNHGPWLAHGTSSLLDGNDSGRRYQGYSM